jgi:tRNA A37 threonylcarbamoyladenosine biosynthesis protein TsaE
MSGVRIDLLFERLGSGKTTFARRVLGERGAACVEPPRSAAG